jgi:hypothetical protein
VDSHGSNFSRKGQYLNIKLPDVYVNQKEIEIMQDDNYQILADNMRGLSSEEILKRCNWKNKLKLFLLSWAVISWLCITTAQQKPTTFAKESNCPKKKNTTQN